MVMLSMSVSANSNLLMRIESLNNVDSQLRADRHEVITNSIVMSHNKRVVLVDVGEYLAIIFVSYEEVFYKYCWHLGMHQDIEVIGASSSHPIA